MTEAEQIQLLRDAAAEAIQVLAQVPVDFVAKLNTLELLADVLLKTSPVNAHLEEPPLGEGPGSVTAQPPPYRRREHGEPNLW